MSASRKVVRAGMEVVDIAGLVPGSSTGEGLGNRFLAGIREVDALCVVLRAFEDPEVPGDDDPVDALGHARARARPRRHGHGRDPARQAAHGAAKSDKSLAGEIAAMERASKALVGGCPLVPGRRSTRRARRRGKSLFLLTDKPVLAVVNVGEDQLERVRRARRRRGRRARRAR